MGSNTGSVGASGSINITGLSTADLKSMPVDVMAFYLAIIQTNELDKQISGALETIRTKQADLAEARKYLDLMKTIKENKSPSGHEQDIGEMEKWLRDRGIAYKFPQGNADAISNQWETNISYLNSYIQNSNSAIELDMLNIQSLMNKRNQALEMSSTIMKKSAESKEAIIRNI
jgi:hypothetical protein